MSDGQHGTGSAPTHGDAQGGPGQPAQGTAQGSGQHAETEWIGSGDPPQAGGPPRDGSDGPRKPGRRALVVGAAVAAVLLVGGGGVLAFQLLSGGGPQPADAIPASAMAYARIDLDPSADQKINAVRLLRSVPQFEEETGITSDTDDLRKRLFELALEEEEACSDLTYDDDIAPWIGDRAGAAALPAAEGEEPDALVVLQVSDEAAARDGVQALIDCGSSEDEAEGPGGIAFVGEYLLLAETQELADEFAADAEEQPLSEAEGFSADMAALDGEGLMSFWVDLDQVVTYAEQEDDTETVEFLEAMGYDELGSLSVAVRAQSDALELVYAGRGDLLKLGLGSDEPVGDVQDLPESTLMAVAFTGGDEAINRLWETLAGLESFGSDGGFGPGALEEFATEVEGETGLAIPEDVGVLLGDEFTMAVDSEGFELTEDGAPDPATINVGARMRTNAAAASDLVTRVEALLSEQGVPFEIAQQEVDDGLVIAANEDYAERLASDGGLGDSDVYDAAVADADEAVSVLFVDIDKGTELADRIAGDLGTPLPAEVSETLEVFRALGVSTTVDGDYTRTTTRLVFDVTEG